MSLAEIEAELQRLTPEELRRLALKSWTVLLEKQGQHGALTECSEEDSRLLAALDEAVAEADSAPGQGVSGEGVRTRLSAWS